MLKGDFTELAGKKHVLCVAQKAGSCAPAKRISSLNRKAKQIKALYLIAYFIWHAYWNVLIRE